MSDSPKGASPAGASKNTAAHPSEGWAGLPVSLVAAPAHWEVSDVCLANAVLAVICSGSGKRWLKSGQRTREFLSAPGMIDLLEAGTYAERVGWAGTAGEVIRMELPDMMVNRLLQERARGFVLQTRHEPFDPAVAQLVTAIWHEASLGRPNGALYTEGMTLALLGLLGERYSTPRVTKQQRPARFHPRDAKRVRDVIIEGLSADLRIETLASLMSMSPHHFARTFKASFGRSPHAYVLEHRIQAACLALRSDTERPIAEIASEFGFANQAHFTEAFRKMVGTTPGRWRRAV